MEEEKCLSNLNKISIKIKSGNKNKSINYYVKRICTNFFSDLKFIEIISNGKYLI